MKLPHQLKMLPFPPRVHDRAYLAINPLGTVPAFFDGETRLTESAAICQYLVSRHGPTDLNVTPDEPGYGAFLNYLHFGEATLTFPQTLVLRYGRFEPEARRQPQVADDYAKWFLARLRTLEPLLAEEPFVCAKRFTAADISVGYALMLAGHLSLHDRFTPTVKAYWERLQGRDGFQRAMAAQAQAALEQGVPLVHAPDAQ